jgi:hypothetical protein
MSTAKVQGVDMTGALVWRTLPPSIDNSNLADMAQIALRPPTEEELAVVGRAVAALENGPLKRRLADRLAQLTDVVQNAGWIGSVDQVLWQSFAKSSEAANAETYKPRLTEYLVRLMCRANWANSSVAAGIARRSMMPTFKGDLPVIYDKLRAADCAASSTMDGRLMRQMGIAADAARGR